MKLRAWLEEHGVTQSELARRCGVSQQAVGKWIAGARRPRADQIQKLAQQTGGQVSAADFFETLPLTIPRPVERGPGIAAEARSLGLDPDAIAAKALAEAVRAEKERRWQEENREAIDSWNAWIDDNGLPLAKYRMF